MVVRVISGSSSRKRTPRCASVISPGDGCFPPPARAWRRHRVMRSTEGPLPADTLSFGKHSGDAVDPRYFHLLLLRHRRHDRRNPPCDHGFSAARRPQHQQIVKSGRSDERRPPRRRLALHFGKVRLFSVLLLLIFYRRKRRHFPFTAVVQKAPVNSGFQRREARRPDPLPRHFRLEQEALCIQAPAPSPLPEIHR